MASKKTFVLALVVCIFSLEVFASPEKFFKKCEKKCCSERNKCTTESRREDIKDMQRKFKVLNDLVECRKDFEQCENECVCHFECASEDMECRKKCEFFPGFSRRDKRRCHRRCRHAGKKCRRACRQPYFLGHIIKNNGSLLFCVTTCFMNNTHADNDFSKYCLNTCIFV